MKQVKLSKDVILYHGDCLEVLPTLDKNSTGACITDPPYGLSPIGAKNPTGGFMSKQWDCGVPGIPFWKAINEIMIPGAFLLAFGGTRTFHRLTCHIEDAGFEIKDMLMWLYGTGWPKGLDISKSIDKLLGKEREVVGTKLGLPGYSNAIDKGRNTLNMANYGLDSEKECQITEAASEEAKRWEGWNTTLKPAWEPIILAMKSCEGT
jgi:site-specific DNA-methyltransferase (adenine-specific)